MAGVRGEPGLSACFAVGDLWLAYVRWVRRTVAEGRPVTVLPALARWEFNGRPLPNPFPVGPFFLELGV